MIPPEISQVFDELQTEITWLHCRWIVFGQLFNGSQARLDLLNESASAFFFVAQDSIISDVQVTLSKLTDPAQTGRMHNLSLEQPLLGLISLGETELTRSLRHLLDEIHSKCAAFRLQRNKRLAHLDLHTALQKGSSTLPTITIDMIETALSLIREFMNSVEGHYTDSETGYEHFIMRASDGDTLVHLLKSAHRYDELVQSQKIGFDDLENSRWKDV